MTLEASAAYGPLWVISGQKATSWGCPLYSRKQTLIGGWKCPLSANSGHAFDYPHFMNIARRFAGAGIAGAGLGDLEFDPFGYFVAACIGKLLQLDLNRRSILIGGAGSDHQIAAWGFVLTPHHLANWPDRIDDGRAGGVCHEG